MNANEKLIRNATKLIHHIYTKSIFEQYDIYADYDGQLILSPYSPKGGNGEDDIKLYIKDGMSVACLIGSLRDDNLKYIVKFHDTGRKGTYSNEYTAIVSTIVFGETIPFFSLSCEWDRDSLGKHGCLKIRVVTLLM